MNATTLADWTPAQLEQFIRQVRIGPSQLPHSFVLKDVTVTGFLTLTDQAIAALVARGL